MNISRLVRPFTSDGCVICAPWLVFKGRVDDYLVIVKAEANGMTLHV